MGRVDRTRERERRRGVAERLLRGVWTDMVRRLIDDCVENEDDLGNEGFSFAYQGLEDRYGQRLFLAGQMIGAVQSLAPRSEPMAQGFHVVRVAGPLDELDDLINERIDDFAGCTVHGLQIVSDDDETWHAFLTLSSG